MVLSTTSFRLPHGLDASEDFSGLLNLVVGPEPNRYASHFLQRRDWNGLRCYMPLKCYEVNV
jgi:hypothetical protein